MKFQVLMAFALFNMISLCWADLQVGVGKRIVTPDPLLPVSGGIGPGHPATRKLHDLWVRAAPEEGAHVPDRNLGRALDGEAVDPRADRGECEALHLELRRRFEGGLVALPELVVLEAVAEALGAQRRGVAALKTGEQWATLGRIPGEQHAVGNVQVGHVSGRVSWDVQDSERNAPQVNHVVVVQDTRRRAGEDPICGGIKRSGQDSTGGRRLQCRPQPA